MPLTSHPTEESRRTVATRMMGGRSGSAGFPRLRVETTARSTLMHFALLLSNLPHVEESRSHYYAFLSLQPRQPGSFRTLWLRVKALAS